jgi:hypothetical protein
MKHVQGNLVSAYLEGEVDMMLHVTNAQGVMGSGIAKEVKDRIPKAFSYYEEAYKKGKLDLGLITSDGKGCYNLTAQKFFGRGFRPLNYGALSDCLQQIDTEAFHTTIDNCGAVPKIGIPYKMGSDRAGGDWEIVKELVEYYLSHYEVYIYKL